MSPNLDDDTLIHQARRVVNEIRSVLKANDLDQAMPEHPELLQRVVLGLDFSCQLLASTLELDEVLKGLETEKAAIANAIERVDRGMNATGAYLQTGASVQRYGKRC